MQIIQPKKPQQSGWTRCRTTEKQIQAADPLMRAAQAAKQGEKQ